MEQTTSPLIKRYTSPIGRHTSLSTVNILILGCNVRGKRWFHECS